MPEVESPVFTYKRGELSNDELLSLYREILLPRMIEEKMLILLRQGKISKWFSGIGQEAISIAVARSMKKEEYILPMHRNLGVFTTRGLPMEKLFAQFQGKSEGYTSGRDRSFHMGSKEDRIVGMISHLGPQMGVADGIALAHRLRKENAVTAVFTGDGGTSEGDFHEAVNTAAVWQLPVMFVIENNGYGLSTPSSEQFRCEYFTDKAPGYGMEAIRVEGNNLLETLTEINKTAQSIRENPRPVIVECMTFRMRGHEEASGTKYVPNELMDEWAAKDPVANYERYLLQEGVLSESDVESIRKEIKADINKAVESAFGLPDIEPSLDKELGDVYAPFEHKTQPEGDSKKEMRFIDAISSGLEVSMERHDNLVLMGQDIAEYGGVFKITQGFVEKFGKDRVRNTPLCESAILGAGLGLSINGMKSMVEMQFADFVSEGITQIVNNLAKSHYRWGQNADVVVRMPTGAGVNAGPFHSQSNEAWFTHTPGLKVVYPSTPEDAKGLLCASFDDPNPIMFFEHKALYRSIRSDVAEGYYTVPIGKAKTVRQGDDLTIITYGMGVHWAKQVLDEIGDISAEVIDLRTLLPLDKEAIYEAVKKTGKVMVLHEDTLTGGIGGELSALITENCFEYLDAPVVRCASLDTPVPFAKPLEEQFLASAKLKDDILRLYNY